MKKIELSDDRISCLCDNVLCHILSFVSMKDSVATSILSKRWNHIWESCLKIDDYGMPSSQYESFANFVSKCLSLHTTNVISLRLCQIIMVNDVRDWVSNSITRNIQSLDLTMYSCSDRPKFQLPNSMFTCKTLKSLSLEGNNILLVVPTIVCLPKLRTLKLIGLYYKNEDGLASLITSSSSTLESVLVHERGVNVDICNIFQAKWQPLILRQLDLETTSLSKNSNVKVPSYVFTCQTLEKLSLRGSFSVCDIHTISLPNLTFLKLGLIKYEDDQIFKRIVSSCTSLESLNVESSSRGDWNIYIYSSTVIKLELFLHSNLSQKLVIDAPSLKYLILSSIGRVDYHIEDLPSLEEAEVNICFNDRAKRLINFFNALWHVKSLKIQQHYVQGLGDALPMFDRLTDLHICMYTSKFGALLEFINNSTKLENLTLAGFWCNNWEDPISVPPCLLTSLRNVSIRDFNGCAPETQMAKYILTNARVLEKMEVRFRRKYSLNCEMNECEKIFSFSRGSEKCAVHLMTSLWDCMH